MYVDYSRKLLYLEQLYSHSPTAQLTEKLSQVT